ncbi:hypothetical protein D3C87_70980 [compost metagenome]
MNEGFDDIGTVLNFAETVSDNLRAIFDDENFIALLEGDRDRGITAELFFSSLSEAEKSILITVRDYKRILNLPNNDTEKINFIAYSNHVLSEIGFIGDSLLLKARVLDKLWDGVKDKGQQVINFANRPFMRALRKCLTYLNSLLGSLSKYIPGADALKEIKDTGESYLQAGEELNTLE